MDARDFVAAMDALAKTLRPEERQAVCRFAAGLLRPNSGELAESARQRRENEHSWELGQVCDGGDERNARGA